MVICILVTFEGDVMFKFFISICIAVVSLGIAEEDSPSNWFTHWREGNCYAEDNDHENAIKKFSQAIESVENAQDFNHMYLYKDRAQVEADAGMYQDSIMDATK